MRKSVVTTVTFAAILLGITLAVSPRATTVASQASTQTSGIDIAEVTRQAKNLPEQYYPAY